MEYHNKQLSIAKEVGDRDGERRAYGNMGMAFLQLAQYEKAAKWFNKAADLGE